MGRRSDHSRDELEALILEAGQALMAEVGFSRFSAREVAKRIGYTVGTIMHLFGSVDRLIMAINSHTFILWSDWLEQRLSGAEGPERIEALVRGYFEFAAARPNLWAAIYAHRPPEGMAMLDALIAQRTRLVDIVVREIAAILPDAGQAPRLARSLVATVHGHCSFALNGSFALLGETDPLDLALTRVAESLRANGAAL